MKALASDQWVEVFPVDQRTTSSSKSYVVVTEAQLEKQQERVENGVEPFATAYDDLIDEADQALSMTLRSVTDGDGDHRFTDEDNDKDAAEIMSTAARDCGLAYWFTGDDTYAERVIDLIHHFCLAPSTYMEPTIDILQKSVYIGNNIMVPPFFYGASFVDGHPHWKSYDGSTPWKGGSVGGAEAAFREWVRDRLDTFESNEPGYCQNNNQWAWRIADYAMSAAFLEDDATMRLAKRMFQAEAKTTCPDGSTKLRPWQDWRNAGSDGGYFNHERNRDTGFHYTQFNLDAMTTALLAFEAYDSTNLWAFNAPTDDFSGSTLRKAFNWFAEYVKNPGGWQWDADGSPPSHAVKDAAAVFEKAHYRWGDYGDVVQQGGGRPHRLRFIPGPITLTHGGN